jgi:hypothetical protein
MEASPESLGEAAAPPAAEGADTSPAATDAQGPELDAEPSTADGAVTNHPGGRPPDLHAAEATALGQAGTALGELPTVAAVRSVFSGTRIEAVARLGPRGERLPPEPRREAAAMLRGARAAGDPERAVAMRDAWRERVAICTTDGGLSEGEAQEGAAEKRTGASPLRQ